MRNILAAALAALLMVGTAGCMKIGRTPNDNPPMRVCHATHPIA